VDVRETAPPPPEQWTCPRCGYSLRGLVRSGAARCPECDRETTPAEQGALVERRRMPRELARIAQLGVVFSFLVMGWTVVGALQGWSAGSWGGVHALLAGLSAPWIVGAVWVWRSLERLHARHEVLAWVAAHATWAYPVLATALLRWT
jgi:hypothetical protein